MLRFVMMLRSAMTISRIPCLAAMALLLGCGFGPDGPMMRRARETAAFSELKKFSTAQNLLFVEEGRFARDLQELQARGEGLISHRMVQASHLSASPLALNGYYYSEIEPHTPVQAGLAAYPKEPGKTGDKVLLILIDIDHGPGPTEQSPVSGDNARIFFAPAGDISIPVTRWPSDAELASDWNEIRRRSPEEGLREAEQIFDDFVAGKPPQKDPVFGDENDLEAAIGTGRD